MGITDDAEFLEDLKKEFYAESIEMLDACESILMNLPAEALNTENDPDIQDYLRKLHTMKGSAQAMSLKDMVKIIHTMETNARNKNFTDLSLKVIDVLRKSVFYMENCEEDKAYQIFSDVLGVLKKFNYTDPGGSDV